MPYAVIAIGIILLVAGVRNTQSELWSLVKGDFSGPNNFVYWFIAIMIVGMIGYVPKIKAFSNALLALIIIALFLSNKGFFVKFREQISSTNTKASDTLASNFISSLLPSIGG